MVNRNKRANKKMLVNSAYHFSTESEFLFIEETKILSMCYTTPGTEYVSAPNTV